MGRRIGLPEFALRLAETAATRSEDPKHKVGAVVLGHDGRVLGVGYNGPPPGIDIPDWSDREAVRATVVHAETNALIGILPREARLLATTLGPCTRCVGMAARLGIKTIVSRLPTPSSHSEGIEETARLFGMSIGVFRQEGGDDPRRVDSADDYQVKTRRTGGPVPRRSSSEWHDRVINFALGIAGEGGEIADEIKKMVYHGQTIEETAEKVREELGDALWYIAREADVWGIPLSDVMQENIDKLWDRYPDGFVEGGGER